jgi:hypothetical protein
MNSGLTGALGTAPLQTVKVRLGSFQGQPHTQIPIPLRGAFILGLPPDQKGSQFTPTGGNKRGEYSVDLQTEPKGGGASQSRVSSGRSSFCANSFNTASGGNSSALGSASIASGLASLAAGSAVTASGSYSTALGNGGTASGTRSFVACWNGTASSDDAVAIGRANTASAIGAIAVGENSQADRRAMMAHASGFFNSRGDAQKAVFIARNKTTTNSAVELFLDGATTHITIPSGKMLSATVNIIGSKSDGSSVAHYFRKCCIKNVGGTTSLVGSVEAIGTDIAAGTLINITADDANDALKIEVTGIAAETWRWTAVIEGAEIQYGT